MYITDPRDSLLRVCLGEVKSEMRPDQLVAFARCGRETLSIKYRELPSPSGNQARPFQLSGSIRNGWSMNTQHFGEQALGDLQCVIVTAVAHHQQPTRQPLLETVRTVARY